jgi:hypothetical protein
VPATAGEVIEQLFGACISWHTCTLKSRIDRGCHQPRAESSGGQIVGISKADKADEYMHYAEHCMKTARTISDREPRILHRQMAAEWIKLAQAMAETDR